MLKQAVLFDFDGTILNSSIRGEKAQDRFFEIARGLGLAVKKEHKKIVAELWGAHGPRKMVAEFWPTQDFEVFIRAWCAIDALPEYMPPLVPFARETLHALKDRGLFLGIVTDRDVASTVIILRAHGIGALFDLVWTRDDSPKGGKGNPESARLVMECLRKRGITRHAILYAGDAKADMEFARAARIPFFAVLSGFSVENDFLSFGLSQECIIPSIVALPALLKQIA